MRPLIACALAVQGLLAACLAACLAPWHLAVLGTSSACAPLSLGRACCVVRSSGLAWVPDGRDRHATG